MIGSLEEASVLAAWEPEYYPDGSFDWLPPEDGWEYIGEGSERIVWRAPSGTIYKIEHDGEEGANSSEMENIDRLSLIHCPGWRLPKATLYQFPTLPDILAMEYVEGHIDTMCRSYLGKVCFCRGRCHEEIFQDMRDAWEIMDGHTGNYLVESDGTRVLVDVTG